MSKTLYLVTTTSPMMSSFKRRSNTVVAVDSTDVDKTSDAMREVTNQLAKAIKDPNQPIFEELLNHYQSKLNSSKTHDR